LFSFVFENAEILLLKAVDEFAAVVKNSGVQNDEIDIDSDAPTLAIGILIRRRRLRIRNGNGIILRGGEGSGDDERCAQQKQRKNSRS